MKSRGEGETWAPSFFYVIWIIRNILRRCWSHEHKHNSHLAPLAPKQKYVTSKLGLKGPDGKHHSPLSPPALPRPLLQWVVGYLYLSACNWAQISFSFLFSYKAVLCSDGEKEAAFAYLDCHYPCWRPGNCSHYTTLRLLVRALQHSSWLGNRV